MVTALDLLRFVAPAWASDSFGMGAFFNQFVAAILMIIGSAVTLIFCWKGLQLCLNHHLSDAIGDFIVMAGGIAIIVGGPAIAKAAIPSAGGTVLLPGVTYSALYICGDTLDWALHTSAYLLPGVLVWRRTYGGQRPGSGLDAKNLQRDEG